MDYIPFQSKMLGILQEFLVQKTSEVHPQLYEQCQDKCQGGAKDMVEW